MQLDEQSMKRVISLANALEQRIGGWKSDMLHSFAEPIEIADGGRWAATFLWSCAACQGSDYTRCHFCGAGDVP
jgi:hypothetical protein